PAVAYPHGESRMEPRTERTVRPLGEYGRRVPHGAPRVTRARAAHPWQSLRRVGPRPRGHRCHAGESYRAGARTRAAALSVGRLRRPADAAARHARRSGAHARHAFALSEGGQVAPALYARRWREQAAADARRIRGHRARSDTATRAARRRGGSEVRGSV